MQPNEQKNCFAPALALHFSCGVAFGFAHAVSSRAVTTARPAQRIVLMNMMTLKS